MQAQRGIALITILMMVALATILAAGIAKNQANTAANTEYMLRQNQALLYSKSAEGFFIELLDNDREQASNVDHLQESWAQPMPAFPVDDGMVSGQLEDQSGKFNLNSLLKADGSVNPAAKIWFEQLLVRVGLPAQLSEAVIDWQDADDEIFGAMGAEVNYYRAQMPSYSTANQPFYHVDQLKQVRGFEQQKYLLLLPYVSALPQSDSRVNINSAPALLLASLDPQLNVADIEQLQKLRQSNLEPFMDSASLWSESAFSLLDPAQKSQWNELLGVQSNFFQAKILVSLNQRKRYLISNIWRQNKNTVIYARQLVPFELAQNTTMAFADALKQQN